MKPIKVVAIQRGCVYDGPGIRTTIFLKGCTLHCPWCCNPEAISYEDDLFIDEDKCLLNRNIESDLCALCVRKEGDRLLQDCPFSVAQKTSKIFSIDDLLREVNKDAPLYKQSGGGVTFSGGEPLLYADELIPVLKKLRDDEISVWVETTLCTTKDNVKKAKPYVDGYIVDMKFQPEMMLNDADYYTSLQEKIMQLSNTDVLYRLIFVHSMLSHTSEVIEKLKGLMIREIELLQCHDLGKSKYIKLRKNFISYSANVEELAHFSEALRKEGIRVKILNI